MTWPMASPFHAVLCALLAAAFWTLLGTALGRHLLPRVLARGAAPVVGWAVHSAAMLPIYLWTGFSPIAVVGTGALCVLVSGFSLSRPAPQVEAEAAAAIPAWTFAAAAILALVPADAILPKFSGDAVQLADPIFDHSKIAIIDAMARLGLPPVNPVFGEFGAPGHLAYYYLWHFSAAELALRARRKRLGSRYRIDVVYRLRVAELDDGACGLAQQAIRRRDLGGRSRRRGLAVADARLDLPRR